MKDSHYIAQITDRLLEFTAQASQLNPEAFQRTVWHVRCRRPYLTPGYIHSAIMAWLGTGFQPASVTGQEMVQIYRTFLNKAHRERLDPW